MRSVVAVLAVVGALLMLAPGGAGAETGKGQLYLDGEVVGTVVNTASLPNGGTDPFFMVMGGVSGQLGIAGVGPGQPGYTGGDWAVYEVTFKVGVEPFLLTSDEAVMAALAAGDVTVVRVPTADFRCPITQP
jgi:hypothetical protein